MEAAIFNAMLVDCRLIKKEEKKSLMNSLNFVEIKNYETNLS
jgi:hypothetical protein